MRRIGLHLTRRSHRARGFARYGSGRWTSSWSVVADHLENLGLAPMINESTPELLRTEWGRKVHDLVKSGKGGEACNTWIKAMAGEDPLV